MLIISYDISDDKIRTCFSKMLERSGAIRLQYSVYEVNNTRRIIDNLIVSIKDKYSKIFTGADSVMIFETDTKNIIKFGNAIHRDKDMLFM